jgi:hypothetical protein
MKTPLNMASSPLREQAANTFLRSRKMPVGSARADLRQLAFALRELHKLGIKANVIVLSPDRDGQTEQGRKYLGTDKLIKGPIEGRFH